MHATHRISTPRPLARAALAAAALTVTSLGCGGSGNAKVVQAPRGDVRVNNLAVIQEPPLAVVTSAEQSLFRQRLTAALQSAGFEIGSGMTVAYRFVDYDPGRGGLFGSGGKAVVEVIYTRAGETVGVVQFTGGLGNDEGRADALGAIARQVTDYTRRNFKQ